MVLDREEVSAKALRWSREFSLLSFGFIDELFFVYWAVWDFGRGHSFPFFFPFRAEWTTRTSGRMCSTCFPPLNWEITIAGYRV